MLTVAELEGMYEDTGGVRVRRILVAEGGGQEVQETWGDLERVPADALDGDAPVWDRVTTLILPVGPIPHIRNGQRIETREQDPSATWREWEISRVGEAEKDGDELLLQLTKVE